MSASRCDVTYRDRSSAKVIEAGGSLNAMVYTRLIKEAKKCIDEEDEQERGQGRALGGAGVHENARGRFRPCTYLHARLIIEIL